MKNLSNLIKGLQIIEEMEKEKREFKYDDYIHSMIKKLPNEIKDMILKNTIMSNIEIQLDGSYKISEFMQKMSNRISILPDEKSVIDALIIFTELYPYWKTGKFTNKA